MLAGLRFALLDARCDAGQRRMQRHTVTRTRWVRPAGKSGRLGKHGVHLFVGDVQPLEVFVYLLDAARLPDLGADQHVDAF